MALYRLISANASFSTASYTFSQSYDSIHNITQKTQNSGASQTTYNYAYAYGGVQPHGPTAIGPFTISHDANGNQITTLDTGTNSESQYLYDEETRLACANTGKQMPTPSCSGKGMTDLSTTMPACASSRKP